MATILIIDDDPDTQSILTTFLRSRGFDAHDAASGREGLERLGEVDPDVVVLDLMMPGMDGCEVARRIRQRPRHADARILMLTARDSRDARQASADAGADGYLVKPIGLEELETHIDELLPGEHWSATSR